MIEWILNLPAPLVLGHFVDFLVKVFRVELWVTFFLSNLGFLILIVLPGIGLSYFLQPRVLDRSLRVCFGVALGFVFPIILFYVLGFSGLYYKTVWILSGLFISGFFVWKFHARFLEEWRMDSRMASKSNVHQKEVSDWIVYGFIVFFFLMSYIAFFDQGTIDYDMLFGQVAPAVHLFFEHVYRPFEMGTTPIVFHELFPGPISFNSAFMVFGVTPWVAVSAVMVFLGPLIIKMFSRFCGFVVKNSEHIIAFLCLATFAAFKMRNGRGTILALIFLFAFLLINQVYKGNRVNDQESFRMSLSAGILLALSLYTNVEIGAILLALILFLQFFNKAFALSLSFGFLFFSPWFLTVALASFKEQIFILCVLYFFIMIFEVFMYFKAKIFRFLRPFLSLPKMSDDFIERILLVLLFISSLFAVINGVGTSLFRLPTFLMVLSGILSVPILFCAFRRPNLDKDLIFISCWLFGVLFIDIYPYLKDLFGTAGLPAELNYLLFDKELGSVFPELRTKIHEYFLPFFSVALVGFFLAWLRKVWFWEKWTFTVFLAVFLFFGMGRLQESDFEEYPVGNTVGSHFYFWLASVYAYMDDPVWFNEQAQEISEALEFVRKPGDRVFNFYAIFSPYYAENTWHYLVNGVGTVELDSADLVSTDYSPELLDQVIEAGADYAVFMPGPGDYSAWLEDERVKVLKESSDGTYVLVGLD